MFAACILLSISLGALALYAWHREQLWRSRFLSLTRAMGADPALAEDAAGLADALRTLASERSGLAKEEYLRRLFESLLNEIRQGVLIVDRDLRIRFANKTIAQLFHRPGIQRLQPLMDEIQDHQVVETVQAALSDGRRSVRQIRFVNGGSSHPTGRHYLVEAAPLPPEAERGAWLMVHDVTEQLLTEQIRKDFVANASHELRTPLTIIQGYLETLQGGLVDEPDAARRCLAVMEKHGKRLVRIIEDMLTISRLESSDAALNIEPFDLRACVQDAIDHLAPMLEGRQVLFDLDFPAEGGTLHGDRFYWDQVLTNLLENAIKENPGRQLTIQVAGRWKADRCLLTISDDGVGIPAHDIPFVFKRFYRGHKHHAQTIKGTGLGLSIVRRSIEAHGGSIELQSTPGVETRFTIDVPARLPLTPIDGVPAAQMEPKARAASAAPATV